MGFFTNTNHFKIFQGVTTWAEINANGKISKPYIVGQLVNSTINPNPIVDITHDSHQIYEKTAITTEHPQWFKMTTKNLRDWIPKEGKAALDLPVGDGDWRIVVFRVAFPLIYGHTLTTGAITDPKVKKQLIDYHPAIADWLHALSLQVLAGKSFPDTRHINVKYAPKPHRGIHLSPKGYIVNPPAALSIEEEKWCSWY
eukprot:scaffold101093_cov27-Attheya_sp.AAC.4